MHLDSDIETHKSAQVRKPWFECKLGMHPSMRQYKTFIMAETHTHINHLCSGAQITPTVGPTLTRYASRVKDLYLANSVDPKFQNDLQI